MKRLILSILSLALLLTGCSSKSASEPDLGLEKLTDGVYIGYDRAKFENISAPPEYFAEVLTPDETALASFFATPPQIRDYENERIFEAENEFGSCNKHGGLSYRTKDGINISIAAGYRLDCIETPAKDLEFMPLSELYEKFEEDAGKFVDKVEIYEMTAITADEFAETAALTNPSDIEEGWCEPKEVYYIRARQFVNDIPIFTGISTTDDDTKFHNGARIEACYTPNGCEYFDFIGAYQVLEEKPASGEFLDYNAVEQLLRETYTLPYCGYDYITFDRCELVYVAHYDGDKTVLTPAWEFYVDVGATAWRDFNVWLRVNAYTGEFMQ